MTALSWPTLIYNEYMWTKIKMIRNERKALAAIGMLWARYAGDIPPTLGAKSAHILDIKKAARALSNYEWAEIVKDYVNHSKGVITAEMMDAALAMRSSAELAITKVNPMAFQMIPFHHVPDEALRHIADTKFLDTSLSAWSGKLEKNMLKGLATEFTIGMAAGEGMDMIASRLMHSFDMGRTSAVRMSRTAIQAAANEARNKVHQANAHLIKSEIFTATLDTATCPICGGYDGTEYKMGSSKPYAPVHPGCRCSYIPRMKSAKELGLGPLEAPPWERESMDGAVPESLHYPKWFMQQEESRQREILVMQYSNKKADAWFAGEWKPSFLEQGGVMRGFRDCSAETIRVLAEAEMTFREAINAC